jgi:CubicO group peptidase (beta-lactamase class C family)
MSFKYFALLASVLLVAPLLSAETPTARAKVFQKLDQELTTRQTDGVITGGQVAVRQNGKLLFSQSYGVVAARSERAVDEKTLFLIGSCSKPFVSICILSLIADDAVSLDLDDPIDRWLAAFAMAKVDGGGTARRAPTVEELMAHRAGIYSQKIGMTQEQAHWIRSFRHTLAEGVDGIAAYNLIAQPGDMYAYSGAGYCVLGRVAELAAAKSFETILQQRLCRPIGLRRTTFFPANQFADEEIATGIGRDAAPHRLGKDHRFPLIGGSLYSTAEEMTQFAQEVASQCTGRLRIEPQLMRELGRVRSSESGYGLGWKVFSREGKARRISHGGSLQSYRAWLGVDLETGVTVASCWTLAERTAKPSISADLQAVLDAL